MSNRRTKKLHDHFPDHRPPITRGVRIRGTWALGTHSCTDAKPPEKHAFSWPLTSEQDCITHSPGLFLTLSLLNGCNIHIKVYTTFENVGNTGLHIPDNLTLSAFSTVKCIATGGHWQSVPVNLALSVAKLPNTCYFNTMSVSKVLQVLIWWKCVSCNLEKGYDKVWSHITCIGCRVKKDSEEMGSAGTSADPGWGTGLPTRALSRPGE